MKYNANVLTYRHSHTNKHTKKRKTFTLQTTLEVNAFQFLNKTNITENNEMASDERMRKEKKRRTITIELMDTIKYRPLHRNKATVSGCNAFKVAI